MTREKITMRYSLWRMGYFGFIIPAVLSIVLAVIVQIFGEATAIAFGVTWAAVLVILVVTIGGMWTQIFLRMGVVNGVYSVWNYSPPKPDKPIAFRIDKSLVGYEREDVKEFIIGLWTQPKLLLEIDQRLRKVHPGIHSDAFLPVTFLTFKKEGTVSFWDDLRGVIRYCRGLQRGQWCEVEWLDPASTHSLIRHELAHVILSKSFPKMRSEKQHLLMERAGIR